MAGDVMIQGDRLVLRALRPAEVDEEWQAMVAGAADPIVSAVLTDEAAFRARLARSGQLREGWLDLAIDLDGSSIGRIQTFVPRGRARTPGTFDVGIGLREHARGKGYGREALILFTDWLFEHAGAEIVESSTNEANHAMRAVFRRAGWTEDGTVTEEGHEWFRYRITRQEWQRRRTIPGWLLPRAAVDARRRPHHDYGHRHLAGGEPMILINLKMQIRPEKMDQWLALADSYAKDVNSEDGCLFFQFARSLTDDNEFVCIEGFKDADAGAAHVKQPYAKKFFEVTPDLVATQPQIIYIDTPHDGFGPMGEIQPR
jgi:RimJ/RimL family protein N-acetyltransferase/quinol monooxygenase YgiN